MYGGGDAASLETWVRPDEGEIRVVVKYVRRMGSGGLHFISPPWGSTS